MNAFFASSESGSGSYWYAPPASQVAGEVFWLFDLIFWISAIFFFVIIAMGGFMVVKYRRRPGVDAQKTDNHNTALELLWSVIPTILVVAFFWFGFDIYMSLKRIPDDAYRINVIGQKWAWSYEYPNGMISNMLVVPQGRNIELVLSSNDVIHSYSIPDFATKMDAVPGRYNRLWFHAENVGEHQVFCTEYCGDGHSTMLSRLSVRNQAAFDDWYETESNFMDSETLSPVDKGKKLYGIHGCAACHSLDGKDNVAGGGPTFKGHWGTTRSLADGSSVTMDDNYVRESILRPNAKIVAGYPKDRMPNFEGRLDDREIAALIQFIQAQTEGK
ncbi:MAG: cytochrome c oxidase subunit II [Planctomycetota bacterium]